MFCWYPELAALACVKCLNLIVSQRQLGADGALDFGGGEQFNYEVAGAAPNGLFVVHGMSRIQLLIADHLYECPILARTTKLASMSLRK